MSRTLLLSICLLSGHFAMAQSPDLPVAEDVESVDAIIDAYYDVFSGAATDPWEYDRDKSLHLPNAQILRFDRNGKVEVKTLADEYIPLLSKPREDFYEVELHREVREFGSIAQVWSTFEIRTEREVPGSARGINSIQLCKSDGRWWIAGWSTYPEGDEKIPEQYLKK